MEVKWNDEFSTGIAMLDNQHKNLINRIVKLTKAIENGREGMEVTQMIDFLKEYTRAHFLAEEKYMDKYKYPESSFHKQEHKKFLKTLNEIKRLHSGYSPNGDTAIHLQYELWQYFKEHLSVVDSVLGKFLLEVGAK
ncbi:MAG: bacteriohemerythrin [bacterium]|nr:bacteriohemerythrin [bacterium]